MGNQLNNQQFWFSNYIIYQYLESKRLDKIHQHQQRNQRNQEIRATSQKKKKSRRGKETQKGSSLFLMLQSKKQKHHRNHQMHDPGAAHEPQAARAPTSSTEDGLLSLTGFLRFGVWVEDGYLSLRAFGSLFLSV